MLSPATGRAEHRALALGEVQDLLALPGLRDNLVLAHDEAVADAGGDEQLAAGFVHEAFEDFVGFVEVDHEPHWLGLAAPARQLVHAERVELAVGCEQHELIGGLRLDRVFEAVVGFEGQLVEADIMALQRANPALLRQRRW